MVKNKKHLTLEGVIQILNLFYFMNKDTSLQTEESKGVLVDKLIQKYRELPPVFPTPKPTLQRLYQLYILYIQNL